MHDVSLPVSYQALVEDLPRELAAEAEVPAAVVATLERIEGDAWNRWRRQLDLPARTRRLLRALDSRQAPIEWGQTSFTAQQAAEVTEAPSLDELRRWLRRLSSSRKRSAAAAVEQWLAGKAGAAGDPTAVNACSLLRALAVGYHLPELSKVFAESLWWDALDRLLTIATCTAPIADVYLTQLAQVELPLLLAAQFAELEPCANLGPPAVRALAAQLEQHVDETGLPLPAIRRSFLPLLASWGRSLEIARQARRQGEVLGAARSRWILAIEQAVRSLRADGTCVFDAPQTEGHRTDWLLTLARSTGRKRLRRVVGVVLGHKRRLPKRVPPLAMHSSKAASAWMRSAWRPGSAQLAVAYDGATLHVEVGVKRNVLISGACTPEVMVDGQLRFPTSRWTENCWQSTRHFDYLELDLEFPGVELERQILFSRTDRWMLVADALLAQEAGELAVRSPLPLWPGVEYVPAGETHEGRLMIGKQTVARCLPLALPEWRSEPAPGILASAEAGLALQHRQASTTRLFAPLLIDFDQRRLSQPYTWRRLTIGEQRRQAPPDAAAGYRVQLGRQQWLIYRSLRQGPARTALGHQTFRQFVVGRVNRKGKIEPLLELE